MEGTISLKDVQLKKAYSTDSDNILRDFYIPMLAKSSNYRRLAGFFTSSSLALAARGVFGLISNNGTMKLVVCPKLSEEDFDILNRVIEAPEEFIERKLSTEVGEFESDCIRDHVYTLGWMVANNKLEIRVAIPADDRIYDKQKGIFHQKVGIFEDDLGNIVSFSGSINETASGWLENIEEFKAFRNWEIGESEYVDEDINKFNTFWNDQARRSRTYPLPKAIENKLVKLAPKDISIVDLGRWYKVIFEPKRPSLFKQQENALKIWKENEFRGLFEMATGTGKTFAALACLEEIFSNENRAVAIIVCPYNHLIRQWMDFADKFKLSSIESIICDATNPRWKVDAFDRVADINNGFRNKLILYTTHNTFSSSVFAELANLISMKSLVIVDEVHGAGAPIRAKGFLDKYNYRLGLSATPSRWLDPEGTKTIYSYFGVDEKKNKGLFTFSLKDALKTINPSTGKTYLAPYEYRPRFVDLSDQELEEYVLLTMKIARAIDKIDDNKIALKQYTLLLEERQKIIRNAVKKIDAFKEVLDELAEISFCLIYCSPQQIAKVQDILCARDIIQHKFTMIEGTTPDVAYGGLSERDFILKNFTEGKYQALVAMRCLDEGVDIPAAQIGIVLASSGNPMQYIQRRGRLLRHSPGKEKAVIYDLIVLPPIESFSDPLILKIEKKILAKEFMRYLEFAEVSLNAVECMKMLRSVKERLGL